MKNSGFTLIELVIVLVVISLIIAGIVSSRSLIYTSKLNSIISDVNSYKSAIRTFKLKYKYLPGDLNNATSYWTGSVTVNGNGNREIEYLDAGENEALRAWQHLSLASMISGGYTGVYNSTETDIGGNVPVSKIANSGYQFYTYGLTIYGKTLNNIIQFGSLGTSDIRLDAGAIHTADAAFIDEKMDDGLPDNGEVLILNATGTTSCLATSPVAYIGTNTEKSCIIYFIID